MTKKIIDAGARVRGNKFQVTDTRGAMKGLKRKARGAREKYEKA